MTLDAWLHRQRQDAERALRQAHAEQTPTARAWERHWADAAAGWALVRLGLTWGHPACLSCAVWAKEDAP